MNKKIIRNSILSICAGVLISIFSQYLPAGNEPANYAGGMFIFGGLVFLDQTMMRKIFGEKKPPRSSLLRLAVYIVTAVILIMLPGFMKARYLLRPVFRAFGIALFLLGVWRFFTYTTLEEQEMRKEDGKKKHEL